ncbi:hypothetical protein [Phenylobacterium sp. J367]|uniref:hypothetical protein n=1 Tax=Phenylobacterium sp. J367 TaxID=2898435 RepID=UPI00215136B7|nr:hypothetical protein [Phenylobacterium sp. J367]MCR5878929.1 hypothetical protein [Phenylobacterium sp. J367]
MLLAMAFLAQDPAADAAKATTVAPAVVEAPAKDQKGGNKDKLFCKNEAPMGSKIPVKKCYNEQEFKMRQLDERRNLDRIQADARAPISR